MTYAHRNGETTPPSETGRYWFKGLVRSMEYAALTSVINDDEYAGYLAAWYSIQGDGWFDSTKFFRGQWWGPVVTPWEADQEQKSPLVSADAREALADYAHEAWSGWMKYLFSKSIEHAGGAVLIPADLVTRWRRQMDTPYADLSENEKESDRREADRISTIFLNHKSSQDGVSES